MILERRTLLTPADVPPSRPDLEVIGVFNPGATVVRGRVVLLVRVVERARERPAGEQLLPRWQHGEVVFDAVADDQLDWVDTRVVRPHGQGSRLTFTSHLRTATLDADGGRVESISEPVFLPEGELEEYGVEDPRITPLPGGGGGPRWVVTYVAVSRHGPATALATTGDFRTFERLGVPFCVENKDVVLFPEWVGGAFRAVHRPVGGAGFARPEMWLAESPDLVHWGRHRFLYGGQEPWESGRVGAGPPPLRTPEGWALVYHGNRRPAAPGDVGPYCASVMLLDADDPARIARRAAEPFFRPEAAFEREGFVPNVAFPTGLVDAGGEWLMYYGAADTAVGVARVDPRGVWG